MTSSALVSIIIPAYNAETFISEAIQSAIHQTYKEIEIIVIDDGSTDKTAQVVHSWISKDQRIKLIRKRNEGPSAARNAGIRAAHGSFVCFLDADDIYLPGKLKQQVVFLELNRDCDLVFSDNIIGDSSLNSIKLDVKKPPLLSFRELFVYRNWFAPLATLLRRSLVDEVGYFDESLRGAEDWDYWIRCSRTGMICYLPGAVGVYRTHPGQAHHNYRLMMRDGLKVIKKSYEATPELYHASLGAMNWIEAKHNWADKKYIYVIFYLLRYLYYARTLKHIRLIRELL